MKHIHHPLSSTSHAFFGFIAAVSIGAGLLCLSAASAKADIRTWTGSRNNNMSDYQNYDPASGTIGHDLVFDKPGLSLQLLAGLSPATVHIKSGASGFLVSQPGHTFELLINDRLTVDASTVATFDVKLGLSKTGSNNVLTFDVGDNGRLNLLGPLALYSVNGTVYKKGGGTLYIGTSSGTSLAGVSLHLSEGTTILKGGSTIGTPTAGANGQVMTIVGSATESSTLAVEYVSGQAARIHGALRSSGLSQSRIEVKGEFRATTLDLSEGATLQFDLQAINSFFSGTALRFDEELNIELIGAEVGQTYHLFRYAEVEGFDPALFNMVGIDPGTTLWTLSGGTVSVQVIPEAGTVSLSIIGLAAVAVLGSRRSKGVVFGG